MKNKTCKPIYEDLKDIFRNWKSIYENLKEGIGTLNKCKGLLKISTWETISNYRTF